MGNRYIVSRDNITPTGGNDLVTIIPASTRRASIVEVSVNGRGSSSSQQEVFITTSSGGTTGGGGLTPVAASHNAQPAAASTVNTTWSVQPTKAAHGKKLGFNALGGYAAWIPAGNKGFEVTGNAAYISVQATSGPTWQAMSISVTFEED